MLDWNYEKINGKYLITMENGKKYFMKESDVDNLQKQLKISEFEAVEMWLEDNGYLENEEQEQLDTQAKGQVKVLAKEKTERKKVVRERKPQPEKEFIIAEIANFLGQNSEISNILVENVGKIITFSYKNANYKLDLVQKRPPKGEK